jgi:hypothetical protein
VNAKKIILPLAFALCLFLPGCHQQEAPKTQTAVFHLFDLFQPDDLTGKVGPDDVGWKRAEWRATEMALWTPPPKSKEGSNQPPATQAVAIAFRAVNDLDEPKIDKGQLSGKITGPDPVLDFSLKENRGGADSVKFIEVRMNVSGAKQVWLRPERAASVDDDALIDWAAQTEKWNTTAEVVDNKVQTYRFEIRSNRDRPPGGGGGNRPPGGPAPGGRAPDMAAAPPGGPGAPGGPDGGGRRDRGGGPRPGGGGAPPGGPGPGGSAQANQGSGDLRHFTLSFRDCKSARFSIESVRLVSEREEKLKDASGQQWAGLAEIYRATLAAKTPEVIRIPLRELPKEPFLELAVGTKEDAPVKFKVLISSGHGIRADGDNSESMANGAH